jgi:hypothetical protein
MWIVYPDALLGAVVLVYDDIGFSRIAGVRSMPEAQGTAEVADENTTTPKDAAELDKCSLRIAVPKDLSDAHDRAK